MAPTGLFSSACPAPAPVRRGGYHTALVAQRPFVEIQGDDYDPVKARSFLYSLKNFVWRAIECFSPTPAPTRKGTTKPWDAHQRFLRVCLQEKTYLTFSTLALVVAAACEVAVPHYSSKALNAVVATRSMPDFTSSVRMVVGLGVVASVMTFFRAGLFGLAGIRLAIRARTMLFRNLLVQEIGFYDGRETGELTNRLSVDCSKLSTVISSHVNVLLRQTIQMLGGSVFLFRINGQLAFFTMLGIAFISLLTAVHGEFMRKMGRRSQDALASANSVAGQILSLIRVVRSHGSESIELRRYTHELRNTINLLETHDIGHSAYRSILRLLQTGLQAWVLGMGAYVTSQGGMTGEQLTSFLFYVNFVSAASFDVGDRWASIQEAIGSTASVFDLMDRRTQLKVRPRGLPPQETPPHQDDDTMYEFSGAASHHRHASSQQQASIHFKNMSFAYPLRGSQPVFERFNLAIPPGQRTAIIGASGSGKSTLLRLMCRFYDPVSGAVLLDGRDLRSFTERELTRKIALLPQESQLFPFSIAENIAYGLDEGSYNMEDIVQAAKEANVHSFISTLPEKYMTRIGENAVTLSGGQRQRLAIARALIRRPEVLLLDEPTSALDVESERVVQEALDLASEGRTVILVAHRLSTIRAVENIVCLQNGQVAEIGNHVTLMARDGAYAHLVRTYREYVV